MLTLHDKAPLLWANSRSILSNNEEVNVFEVFSCNISLNMACKIDYQETILCEIKATDQNKTDMH